jgi:hypothetical protein
MTPLEIKTCGESEFDIFEAKKRFPDTGKAYYVLKGKVAKIGFFRLFALIYRPSLNQESVFSFRKCQIRLFLPLEGLFQEKFFHVIAPPPYCVVVPDFEFWGSTCSDLTGTLWISVPSIWNTGTQIGSRGSLVHCPFTESPSTEIM